MWSFIFRIREQKCDKNGLVPIELVININRKRSVLFLPMKVYPEEFHRLRAFKRDNHINMYCEQERVRVFRIVSQLQAMGREVTAESVKEVLKNGFNAKSYRLSDLRDDYMKIIKKRLGVDLSDNVYRKYVRIMRYVIEFLKNKECRDVTNSDMKNIVADMRSRQQNSTFANQWVIVKTFITFGINNNKIPDNNLFATIKVVKRPKPVEYLTSEEVEKIRNTKFESERLQRVADFAILEINLGLAYCDLVDIKREDIQQHKDTLFIKKKRQKTNIEFLSVVNDEALAILEKYNYNIDISNACYNRYLKEIGGIVGIEKHMHSHLLRHTFAHYQLNERHLNISTVSKMLGHTNLKQTQHYCRKHTSTIVEEFLQANNM